MLIQKDQKKIRSVLENIYKLILPKKDINYFKDEIIQIIKNFNKKNPKKKTFYYLLSQIVSWCLWGELFWVKALQMNLKS